MKKTTLLIATIFGLTSCNNSQTTTIEIKNQPTIYTKDQPATYNVDDTDEEMNTAIKTANQTLDKFNESLNSNYYGYFSLKTKFKTDYGGEHIWVNNIIIKDNRYFGVVGNLPEATTDVKIGDNIEIDKNNISDWMYIDNGKLKGGYTIKLLRNRMSAEERQQFDNTCGFIIEN